MGAGALFSVYEGKGDKEVQKTAITHAMVLIFSITLVLNVLVYAFMDPILTFLRVPEDVWQGMKNMTDVSDLVEPKSKKIPGVGYVSPETDDPVTGILYMRRITRKYNKYNKE